MSDYEDIKIFTDDDEDLPLIPPGGCEEGDGKLIFDETGDFVMVDHDLAAAFDRPTTGTTAGVFSFFRACSLLTLNGSWKISITPRSPHLFWNRIRGPMRIEAANNILRVSGDVYVSRFPVLAERGPTRVAAAMQPVVSPISPASLIIRKNWYPSYPQNQYKWYFRSTGVSYSKSGSEGTLKFKFVRHLWNAGMQEFTSTDAGWMKFSCTRSLLRSIYWPQPTIEMKGEAMIGGTMHNVSAIKTSPYYRGCQVEVDVMKNRQWPATATQCGGSTYSFTGVYRNQGLDFRAIVDETDVPEDSLLTSAEMHNLLSNHRNLATTTNQWRLWVLVGSKREEKPGTLGLMFDGIAPHREGVVGYYDPRLGSSTIYESSARGKKIGDVPVAFLRTLVHEAGHAFNLYHPKADCHSPAIGTTIMNQTGDVVGFASTSNPYPCNATLGFNEHNRTSLIHSPDPQVKPGWKEFGWGHGGVWCGVPEPTDVLGLETASVSSDLLLDLDIPAEVFPGELILANFKVTNVSDVPVPVSTALNLSEGYLRLHVTDPSGDTGDVGDVLLLCGDGRVEELQPGEERFGSVQLLYTNRGFKFDQIGRYTLQANLDLADGAGTVVRSEKVQLVVRPAVSEPENALQELTLNEELGVSLALGDFGTSSETRQKVARVADEFGDTDTGAACAMVMANSLGRDFRDPFLEADVLRAVDESEKDRYLSIATKGRNLTSATQLATAVAATRELEAPILKDIHDHISDKRFKKADRDQAQKIYEDYVGESSS